MVTRRPRALSRRPRLEAVRPLPRLDATPPVTKRCLVDAARDEYDAAAKGRLPWSVRSGEAAGPRAIRISASRHPGLQQRFGLRRGARARLAFRRLPDPLGCRLGLLVRLTEPGQRHGADDREAEPEQSNPAEARPGMVTEE